MWHPMTPNLVWQKKSCLSYLRVSLFTLGCLQWGESCLQGVHALLPSLHNNGVHTFMAGTWMKSNYAATWLVQIEDDLLDGAKQKLSINAMTCFHLLIFFPVCDCFLVMRHKHNYQQKFHHTGRQQKQSKFSVPF